MKAMLAVGVILSMPLLSMGGSFEAETTDGAGGKSGYLRNPTNSSVFAGTLLIVKNNSSSVYTRKGYIRFDTSGLGFEPKQATLSLTVATIDPTIVDNDQIIYVFGITNQALDLVALTNGLAWSNAPANNATSWHEADLDEAELLGTFILDYDGDYASPVGTVVEFSNQALIDFVIADTNGLVTFLLGRQGPGGTDGATASKDLNFAGDTHGTYPPPKLTCGTGFISMTDIGTGNVNISDLGGVDWKIWSDADLTPDEQMDGGSGLGELSFSSPGSFSGGNSGFSLLYSWTNGTPTETATGLDVNHLNTQVDITNAVFSTSVVATPASNSAYITFGQWNAKSEITASLSDGSASPQTLSFTNAQHQTVRIDFSSNSRATLNVSIVFADDIDLTKSSTLRFQSVALANAIPSDPGTIFFFQ